MTWLEELDAQIRKRWEVGEVFRVEEVYRFEGYFSRRHPANSHVREKIRQTLQYLRDDDILEFVDDAGTYMRIK